MEKGYQKKGLLKYTYSVLKTRLKTMVPMQLKVLHEIQRFLWIMKFQVTKLFHSKILYCKLISYSVKHPAN